VKIPESILDRINVKSVSLLVAILMIMSGIFMIMLGIKDDGFVDIKSALVNGQIKSGFVGVILVFFGTLIVMTTLMTRRGLHKVTIKNGKNTINWEGPVTSVKSLKEVSAFLGNGLTQITNNVVDSNLPSKDRINQTD